MRKVLSIPIALIALLLVSAVALACHNAIDIDTSHCEKVTIDATYYGNSGKRNMVELYVDGTLVKDKWDYSTNVSVHYSASISPGPHTAVVKGYERVGIIHGYWELKATITKTFTIESCIQHVPVTLCHATPPDTAANGYHQITTDDDGALGHAAQHSADIIPPFEYYGGSFPGLNWDGLGQATWENDCVVPRENSASLEVDNDCDGWEVAVTASEGASYSAPSGSWTAPYILESVSGGTVVVTWTEGYPLQVELNYSQINEPEYCQQVHEVTYGANVDCEGVVAWYAIDGVSTVYATHSWQNIYVLESVEIPAFSIPTNYGELYDLTEIPAVTYDEPEECLVVLGHDYDIDISADCEGWEVDLTMYEGGQYATEDPLSGVWTQPYVLESAHGSILLSWPDGFEKEINFHAYEPEYCLHSKDWGANVLNDCDRWSVEFDIPEGGTLILDEGVELSGAWQDPYKLEAVPISGTIAWLDQEEEVFSFTISELEECFVCKITPLYRMITLIDYDAPDWYYGTGARNGTCWVIMGGDAVDAPGVSVDRQKNICSVCAHPEFIYEADQELYDAWVVRDCHGNISYPDPLWKPSWYRADYDELECHRKPSCIIEPEE
jgi:hypothetical protein